MTDMHTHTHRSADSEETMAAYVEKAGELGVERICFTDHADYNPRDMGWEYYESEEFFEDLEHVNSNSIELLAGVEFGEPHLYPDEFQKLLERPYDFVIGSVHYIDGYPDMFFSELLKAGVTAEQCYASYWDSVLECVKFGGFDCLGHIDIPKRYYKTLIYDEAKLREIFRVMLDRNIILEINTSSLRRGIDEPMPGSELLELYRGEGGRYAVIGSDAHSADDLAAGNLQARTLLEKYKIHEVTFRERHMEVIG